MIVRVVMPALLAVTVIGCSNLQPTSAATREVELVLDLIPCARCVATVRGALGELPGVTEVFIREPIPDFRVTYDPAKTDVEAILAALAAAGEPARPR